MGRPKKEKPNRKDGCYEIKITVGKSVDGSLIRKSFYSTKSKEAVSNTASSVTKYRCAQQKPR